MIVRHGEALSNADDTVAGHLSCKGLTDHGRSQVEALANRLRRTGELDGAAALYSSVLRRAVETAEILAPALGGLEVRPTCDLCERHVGEADGLTWAEYEALYGEMKPPYDPVRPMAPGGESSVGFLDRAEAALYDVAARHPGGLVVIAGHGGIVGALARPVPRARRPRRQRPRPRRQLLHDGVVVDRRPVVVRALQRRSPSRQGGVGSLPRAAIPAPDWVTLES